MKKVYKFIGLGVVLLGVSSLYANNYALQKQNISKASYSQNQSSEKPSKQSKDDLMKKYRQ